MGKATVAAAVQAAKVMRFRLLFPAGKATPAPPIGPVLGQRKIPIPQACKELNDRTAHLPQGAPVTAVFEYTQTNAGVKFSFTLKGSPVSYLIKQEVGIDTASKQAGRDIVGTITRAQIRKIAEKKMVDTNAHDLAAVERMVQGTALSMGITLAEE